MLFYLAYNSVPEIGTSVLIKVLLTSLKVTCKFGSLKTQFLLDERRSFIDILTGVKNVNEFG